MTRDALLTVIYQHYPRGVACHEPAYKDSVEHLRLVEAARRAVAEYETWRAMLRRLGERFIVQNESLFLLAGGVDPAYSAFIFLPARTLGFHVCLLGPYYGIHRTGATDEEPAATELARVIVAAYPGHEPIQPELGNELVPDVDGPQPLGKCTIHDCLLSEVWRRSSFELP